MKLSLLLLVLLVVVVSTPRLQVGAFEKQQHDKPSQSQASEPEEDDEQESLSSSSLFLLSSSVELHPETDQLQPQLQHRQHEHQRKATATEITLDDKQIHKKEEEEEEEELEKVSNTAEPHDDRAELEDETEDSPVKRDDEYHDNDHGNNNNYYYYQAHDTIDQEKNDNDPIKRDVILDSHQHKEEDHDDAFDYEHSTNGVTKKQESSVVESSAASELTARNPANGDRPDHDSSRNNNNDDDDNDYGNDERKDNGGNVDHHDETVDAAENDDVKDGSNESNDQEDQHDDDDDDDETIPAAEEETRGPDSHSTVTTGTTTTTDSAQQVQQQQPRTWSYGVDMSWPMQSIQRLLRAESSGASPFKGRYRAYHSYLQGCAAYYHNAEACKRNDNDRMRLNQNQPRHMRNFTTLGYAKVMAPTKTFAILQAFWRRDHRDDSTSTAAAVAPNSVNHKNKKQQQQQQQQQRQQRRRRAYREEWSEASIYVNHWSHPTEIYPVDHDAPPYGLNLFERQVVIEEVRDVLQRWISKGTSSSNSMMMTTPLIATSMYGIRVYPHGSILAPHVDRLPLVLSAVINVAQGGMQDDWPLEVIGHDGVAVNLTLQPGEMIVYEGHSVIHGRPFPLNGSYYANLFLHFEPVGYTEEMERKMMLLRRDEQQQEEAASNGRQHEPEDANVHDHRRHSAKELFEKAFAKQLELQQETKEKRPPRPEDNTKTGHNRLPSYIQQGSQEAKRWLQDFVFFRKETPKKSSSTGGGNDSGASKGTRKLKHVTTAHIVAANGDLEQLKQVEKENPESLFKADDNGWKPLHEAARAGKTDIVEYLLKRGKEKDAKVDINERTNQGKGANALWWAKQQLPDAHPVIKLLEQHGAVAVAPNQ